VGFAFVLHFFAVTGLLEHVEVCKNELRPLTILGTRMRAICECVIRREKITLDLLVVSKKH